MPELTTILKFDTVSVKSNINVFLSGTGRAPTVFCSRVRFLDLVKLRPNQLQHLCGGIVPIARPPRVIEDR